MEMAEVDLVRPIPRLNLKRELDLGAEETACVVQRPPSCDIQPRRPPPRQVAKRTSVWYATNRCLHQSGKVESGGGAGGSRPGVCNAAELRGRWWWPGWWWWP